MTPNQIIAYLKAALAESRVAQTIGPGYTDGKILEAQVKSLMALLGAA